VRSMVEAHLGGGSDQSKALWLVWVYEAFLRHRATQTPIGSGLAAPLRPTLTSPR
jgi:hypothetical protein